jgi:hypothetical protein
LTAPAFSQDAVEQQREELWERNQELQAEYEQQLAESEGSATSVAVESVDPAEAEASNDGHPKLPDPLTDEEVALVVEDEVDAVLLRWQSLSTHATIDLNTGQVRRNMNFNTHVILTNDTKVTHIGSQLYFTEAIDQDGEQILPTRMDIVETFGNVGELPRTSYYPPQRDSNHPSPYRQVSGAIQNYSDEPESFRKLRGFVPIRIAAQTVVIDKPLDKGDDFAELAPGLTYKVHEISTSGSYHQPMVHFARPGADPNQGVRADQEPGIAKIEVLDATGEPIPVEYNNQGTTRVEHHGQRMYVFYQQPRTRKVPGRTPTTLRFHVALRMVEAPVWFAFEDVPLP